MGTHYEDIQRRLLFHEKLSLSLPFFFDVHFYWFLHTIYSFLLFFLQNPQFSHRSVILQFPMHCSDFYKSYKLCSCSHHSSLYSRFSRVKNSKKIFKKSTRIQRQDFPNFQRNKKNSIKSQKKQQI